MYLRRILSLFTALSVVAGVLTGCGSDNRADLEYANSLFSYEEDEAVSSGGWCPYDDAYLTRLREEYALEELVADCKSDFERVQKVTRWVTNLWPHDGDNIPEQNDPLFILESVTKEGGQYRCVEYGTVICGCLNALGIPSRTIGLKTQDVETREYGAGHVAAEAYLKDYGKWVFIDGQWGKIPVMGDTPLNAVQLGEVLQNPGQYEEALCFLSFQDNGAGDGEYEEWIGEYLYYYDVTSYTQPGKEEGSSHIMLTPSGAADPKIFQIYYPLDIDAYTHSVPSFYPQYPQDNG